MYPNVKTDKKLGIPAKGSVSEDIANIGNRMVSLQTTRDAMLIAASGEWYLPSEDELSLIYTALVEPGIITIDLNNDYWSSTEDIGGGEHQPAILALAVTMSDGLVTPTSKTSECYVRAIRSFISSVIVYAVGDIGPAGGWIFWKSGNNYLECASENVSMGPAWSNIVDAAAGASGTAVGTGQANSTAIMAQSGHTDSAALICKNYVTTGMAGSIDSKLSNIPTMGWNGLPSGSGENYTYLDAGGEQIVARIIPGKYDAKILLMHGILLDLSWMTKAGTVRLKYSPAGGMPGIVKLYPHLITDGGVLFIDFYGAISRELTLTYQEAEDEGADRPINFEFSFTRG